MADLGDARTRLTRAKKNIRRLDKSVGIWQDTEPYPHRIVFHQDAGDKFSMLARVEKEPPKGWGLRVSDILGDVRFALDHIAYQLAIANTGEDPPPDVKDIQFPVLKNPARWAEKDGHGKFARGSGLNATAHMSNKAQTFIESIQPYHAPNYEMDWLWMLNELCNVNKHRFIQATPAALTSTSVELGGTPGGLVEFEGLRVDRLVDGAVVAHFRPRHEAIEAEVDVKAALHAQIAFEPGPPAYSVHLLNTLLAFEAMARWVHDQLRGEVESPGRHDVP